ncbi:MAG: FapA family protein [bacterium]|nr:FapA family protein [bacterium]MDW8104604.1 FapA family protein [Armatimonadota bacterium]
MSLKSALRAPVDGQFWVFFNEDKTQAMLVVTPPQGDGNPVRVAEVVRALEEMGVAYGIDQQAIRDTIERATNLASKVQAVVAQGVLPVHGTDAKVHYRLPEEIVLRPLPLLPDGSIDYLQIDPARYVEAGQLIATVVPAQHGRPGRTLTFPPQTVPQRPGREANLRAGENVIASEDNLQFSAERAGYVYLAGDRLSVLPATPITGDLQGEQEFDSTLVLNGRILPGARVRVHGDAAISGQCERAILHVRGSCYLRGGAQRSEIAAEGNVLLRDSVVDCTLHTRRQVVALHEQVQIVGGRIVAFEGVQAYTMGTPAWTPTEVVAGVDTLGDERLFEIAEEIRQCEANIQKINTALRPYVSISAEVTSPEQKEAIQRLIAHRRRLEARLKELQHEKRTLTIQVNAPVRAEVVVRGTVYPGVKVTIGKHSYLVENDLQAVRFSVERGQARVQVRPLERL